MSRHWLWSPPLPQRARPRGGQRELTEFERLAGQPGMIVLQGLHGWGGREFGGFNLKVDAGKSRGGDFSFRPPPALLDPVGSRTQPSWVDWDWGGHFRNAPAQRRLETAARMWFR
jgi:hypothetical protein